MASFNRVAFDRVISKPLENVSRRLAIPIAQERAQEKKENFILEFLNDPISQELLEGPTIEGEIDGVKGNLYSFLGFPEDYDPIGKLEQFFEDNIYFLKTGTYDSSKKTWTFKMKIPTFQDIKNATQMNFDDNWAPGRSWVAAIESGIPGLAMYKFSLDREELGKNAYSRSGTGVQRKNIIHAGAVYRAQKYMSNLLNLYLKDKF